MSVEALVVFSKIYKFFKITCKMDADHAYENAVRLMLKTYSSY